MHPKGLSSFWLAAALCLPAHARAQPVAKAQAGVVGPKKPPLYPLEQVTPPSVPLPDGYARFNATRPIYRAPVRAAAWVLMDAESGRVLAEHNARARMFPASTTKTMTALVAIRKGVLDSIATIGPNPPRTGESSIHLMQGEKFRLADLVRAALIKSANDSCTAIAENVGGSVPHFVQMMNAMAREVGATDTHFANPHGLHDPHHYTTALDLARIGRAAMQEPFFRAVVGTREATIHGNWKIGPQRWLANRNRLLFRWGECDGVKTGYTKQAGNCLIASATRRDPQTGKPWRLLSVVMKSPDSWSDSYNLLTHEGFEKFAPTEVAQNGEVAGEFSLPDGAEIGHAISQRAMSVALRGDEQNEVQRSVRLLPLSAPIKAGQRVGVWEIRAKGALIDAVPLVSQTAIAAASPQLMPRIGSLPSDSLMRWIGLAALSSSLVLLMAIWIISRR